MNALAVTDSLSNRNEHIEELAKLIGRGRKRELFALIYSRQKQRWTVKEVAAALKLAEKNASALAVTLAAGGALHQDKAGGRVTYRKVPAHKHIKDKVLKLAGDGKAISAIPTKRRPELSGTLFRQPKAIPSSRSRVRNTPGKKKATRVAFLMASPTGAGAINVGMDFREAQKAVLASNGRDKLELKAFPAADVNALLDALNEYAPDVIQFSGHGSENSLLLDGSEVTASGGLELDFEVAREMLSATANPPKCLVLTACKTARNASTMLGTIPVIVAMSGNISDFSATLFCRRFYAAIASGQTIEAAFRQSKTVLKAEGVADADFPVLLTQKPDSAQISLV